MKSKEEILEGYFGSDYWLLKERDDLQYILRAMDEYAKQKLQHGVSGKRPDLHCQNACNWPDCTLDRCVVKSSAACASGAVATVAEGEEIRKFIRWKNEKDANWLKHIDEREADNFLRARKSSGGQP